MSVLYFFLPVGVLVPRRELGHVVARRRETEHHSMLPAAVLGGVLDGGARFHLRGSRNGTVFERSTTPLEETVRYGDGAATLHGRVGITHAPCAPRAGVIITARALRNGILR